MQPTREAVFQIDRVSHGGHGGSICQSLREHRGLPCELFSCR